MSIPRVNKGRSVDSLADREIKRWSLFRVRKSDAPVALATLPVITISRACGSLGGEVGKRVAERLGFEYWSQELVHTIADNLGTPSELLASVDERHRGAIEDLITSILLGNQSSQQEYVRQLRRVVRAIERRGSAVIIGRGAQFIVDQALRVRVIAPVQHRTHSYAARHGLSDEEAATRVRDIDRERAAFMRKHFAEDVADFANYDLLINTASMTLDEAADVLCAAHRARFGQAATERPKADNLSLGR